MTITPTDYMVGSRASVDGDGVLVSRMHLAEWQTELDKVKTLVSDLQTSLSISAEKIEYWEYLANAQSEYLDELRDAKWISTDDAEPDETRPYLVKILRADGAGDPVGETSYSIREWVSFYAKERGQYCDWSPLLINETVVAYYSFPLDAKPDPAKTTIKAPCKRFYPQTTIDGNQYDYTTVSATEMSTQEKHLIRIQRMESKLEQLETDFKRQNKSVHLSLTNVDELLGEHGRYSAKLELNIRGCLQSLSKKDAQIVELNSRIDSLENGKV